MPRAVPSIVRMEKLLDGVRLAMPEAKMTAEGIVAEGHPVLFGNQDVDLISESDLLEINRDLAAAITLDMSGIQWADHAEFMLVNLNEVRYLGPRILDDRVVEGVGENALSYSIGRPSRQFMAYLLSEVPHESLARATRNGRWGYIRRRIVSARKENGTIANAENGPGSSLLDVISEAAGVSTLRISSPRQRADFESAADSFVFHAAYNLDVALRVGVDPLFSPARIQRMRRAPNGSLDAPRQTYEADLIQHYLMGVAAEIPLLQYLAYYHIAEHYFEKVFNDDLVNQVRKAITDPSFSVRRTRDIQAVIRAINNSQRQVKEGGVNELKSLELVLGKFVNIDRLVTDLESWDPSLIGYYSNSEIQFAGAGKVDLRLPDHEKVKKRLAQRIYKVRNSLVHAKEGSLPKYTPFAHDDELSKEIPLIRFAAEQIVIENGRAM